MPLDDSGPGSAPSAGFGHLDEDALVLASLARELPSSQRVHLDACGQCRAEVAALSEVVTTARSGPTVDPVAVPPGTWAAIAHELDFQDQVRQPLRSVAPVGSPPVVVRPPAASRSARRSRRWLPVAAALLVGVGLGVVGARWVGSSPAGTERVPVTPLAVASLEPLDTTADPSGHGQADVVEADGVRRLHLTVSGVAPATDGVLEVWLLDSDGGLVSLGIMSLQEMTVALPADLDLDRFDVVDVSREPLDGNPAHSADSVLRGDLTRGA